MLGLGRTHWWRLQDALTALGFDTRGSSGKSGANARRVVVTWQESKRQEATGYLVDRRHDLIPDEAQSKLVASEAAVPEGKD